MEPLDLLVPRPRKLARLGGAFPLRGPLGLRPPPRFESPALAAMRAALVERGAELAPGTSGARPLELVLDGRAGHPREGYALTVAPDRILLVASRVAGLNHGLRTLTQLVRLAEREWMTDGPRQELAAPVIPALAIEDAPVFERRGVMLDVSRDRVPRMDFLLALVERLAEWKLNELQLYCEHAFAYRDHAEVWRGVDPFTPDEIRALDAHCKAHGIELVPNQQSFGHLHHWLKHDRYRHLAEVPDGIVHPFLGAGETRPEPFSLCPTDPRSLDFLAGLYDELLPCFGSEQLNVGLDETIDLGPGRSAAAIRAQGVGRVYLDFLRGVHGLASARGKRMQFWADILLHHRELVPEVPRDATAMLWGYEADHPFEEETRVLADAGADFYVCPGTSAWQSIGGRLENMLANIRSAARWGFERGARGLLITDWGDRGHLQPPFASWPGLLTAAQRAWDPGYPDADEKHEVGLLAQKLNAHMTPGAPRSVGVGVLELAHVAATCSTSVRNASPLSILLTKCDQPFPELSHLRSGGLSQAAYWTELAKQHLDVDLASLGPSGSVLRRELLWGSDLMLFACRLGELRLASGDAPVAEWDRSAREPLAERLAPLIAEHRALWPERSRPGGLDRSARWLERILAALRAR
jgi:hexosaminidase